MAKLRIEIEMGNAAFSEDPREEVEAVLLRGFRKLDWSGEDRVKLLDSNGNRCGFAEVVED